MRYDFGSDNTAGMAPAALDGAGIEIPFPHQVAVPYRDDIAPLVRLATDDGGDKT